jgi:hypothetical protein
VITLLSQVLASAVFRMEDGSGAKDDDQHGPTVPLEKLRPPLVEVELSAALREQLQNLGIFARPLSGDERLARERELPFYDQVPRKAGARDRDFQVVDARISKESAIAAVAEWERQFLNPETRMSRVPDITAALAATFEEYRDTAENVEPAGYRAWLEARTGNAAARTALAFIREVGQLFRRIDLMGLTSMELEVSKAQILFRVLQDAPSMRAGFLRRVIDTVPATAGAPEAGNTPRSTARRGSAASPPDARTELKS